MTGNAVTRGHLGGDAEQTGSAPSTYPVRFPPDRLGRSVVLDELTDHDIGRPGINDEEPGASAGDDPGAAHRATNIAVIPGRRRDAAATPGRRHHRLTDRGIPMEPTDFDYGERNSPPRTPRASRIHRRPTTVK